jgi:hypothetical protein
VLHGTYFRRWVHTILHLRIQGGIPRREIESTALTYVRMYGPSRVQDEQRQFYVKSPLLAKVQAMAPAAYWAVFQAGVLASHDTYGTRAHAVRHMSSFGMRQSDTEHQYFI